jgi:heterotetrameric sarcosine oxidase gamma subunit
VAAVYSDVDEELAATRDAVGLADVSALAKISLLGGGVAAATRELVGNESAARPGSVARLDSNPPVLACRTAFDQLMLLASESDTSSLERLLTGARSRAGVVQQDETSGRAGFALIGPAGESVFRRVTAFDVSHARLPAGACAETALAGVHALIVRPPREKVLAARVYVPSDYAEYVWNALVDAGTSLGLRTIGLDAYELALGAS